MVPRVVTCVGVGGLLLLVTWALSEAPAFLAARGRGVEAEQTGSLYGTGTGTGEVPAPSVSRASVTAIVERRALPGTLLI
jgi:hypothetical protein